MGVISWVILGLIAGFIGSKIVNKSGQGFLMNVVLGIVGAVVGGFIVTSLGIGGPVSGINFYSIIVAVVGAVVVIWLYNAISGRRA
ncbi:MAG: GlsB/YeaQ/YmgE family stress response membrane protein [Beijerinckiaceae bacterium]